MNVVCEEPLKSPRNVGVLKIEQRAFSLENNEHFLHLFSFPTKRWNVVLSFRKIGSRVVEIIGPN